MGYRLEISRKVYSGFSGGKLYGYIEEEKLKKCKSFRWLVERGYLEEEDVDTFDYGAEHTTVLTAEEFKEFIKLYKEDMKNCYQDSPGWFYEQYYSKEFQELIESSEDKIIEWW